MPWADNATCLEGLWNACFLVVFFSFFYDDLWWRLCACLLKNARLDHVFLPINQVDTNTYTRQMRQIDGYRVA